jgi:hypothetical protein
MFIGDYQEVTYVLVHSYVCIFKWLGVFLPIVCLFVRLLISFIVCLFVSPKETFEVFLVCLLVS